MGWPSFSHRRTIQSWILLTFRLNWWFAAVRVRYTAFVFTRRGLLSRRTRFGFLKFVVPPRGSGVFGPVLPPDFCGKYTHFWGQLSKRYHSRTAERDGEIPCGGDSKLLWARGLFYYFASNRPAFPHIVCAHAIGALVSVCGARHYTRGGPTHH